MYLLGIEAAAACWASAATITPTALQQWASSVTWTSERHVGIIWRTSDRAPTRRLSWSYEAQRSCLLRSSILSEDGFVGESMRTMGDSGGITLAQFSSVRAMATRDSLNGAGSGCVKR